MAWQKIQLNKSNKNLCATGLLQGEPVPPPSCNILIKNSILINALAKCLALSEKWKLCNEQRTLVLGKRDPAAAKTQVLCDVEF